MKTIDTNTALKLAEEIHKTHQEAEEQQREAAGNVNNLIALRTKTATLVETAKANLGASFLPWWREQKLPKGWERRYMRIAKTAGHLNLADKSQLKLIGIIPEEEEKTGQDGNDGKRGTMQTKNPFAWVNFAGKLRAALTVDHVKSMTPDQRATARLHLKPIVELIEALKD